MLKQVLAAAAASVLAVGASTHLANAGGVYIENPAHDGQVSENAGEATVAVEQSGPGDSYKDVRISNASGEKAVGTNMSEDRSGNDSFLHSQTELNIGVGRP